MKETLPPPPPSSFGVGDAAGGTRRSLSRSSSGRLGLGRGLFIQRSHSAGDDNTDTASSLDGQAAVAPPQVKRLKSKLPSPLALRRRTSASSKSSVGGAIGGGVGGGPPPSLPILHHAQSTPALFVHPLAAAPPVVDVDVSVHSTATAASSVSGASQEEESSWLRSAHVTAATIKALEVTDATVLPALEMLEALESDDRLIRAYDILRKIEAHLDSTPVTSTNSNTDKARVLLATPERRARTGVLRTRAQEVLATLADLEDKSAWSFDHSLFGVDTYYRRIDADANGEGGGLYVMVDTKLDRRKHLGMTVFEPICVLKEGHLYSDWSPYCPRNAVLRSFDGKGDLLNFILFDLKVMRREIFLRTFICDDSLDAKRMLIVGNTIARDAVREPLPPVCAEQEHPPMHFHRLRALIRQEDQVVHVTIAAQMDLNTSIPTSLVDWAVRRFFQVLVHLIVRASKAAVTDPVHNVHARLIRQDPFYRRFLLPKYLLMCRHYGWEFPGVRALDALVGDEATMAATAPAPAPALAEVGEGVEASVLGGEGTGSQRGGGRWMPGWWRGVGGKRKGRKHKTTRGTGTGGQAEQEEGQSEASATSTPATTPSASPARPHVLGRVDIVADDDSDDESAADAGVGAQNHHHQLLLQQHGKQAPVLLRAMGLTLLLYVAVRAATAWATLGPAAALAPVVDGVLLLLLFAAVLPLVGGGAAEWGALSGPLLFA